jgi:peptidoglycan/xylan/chitin deacetylase (PgdA/CDA1 family)
MRPGWYILLYHDVSWEQNPYLRGIGGTCPPDLLRSHLQALSRLGRLASPDQAFADWTSGKIDRPVFSFWFDDGFIGVRKYALPILQQHGITGAISVCSRFVLRRELFWRFKLSFLSACDGLRLLRSRLKPLGYVAGRSVKQFTLDHFSIEVAEMIDAVYRQCTSEHQRADAFRLFARIDDLQSLKQEGWIVTNHSAAHYPVSESSAIDLFAAQFQECAADLDELLRAERKYWVVPFDRSECRAPTLLRTFTACNSDAHLVLVGDEVNHPLATNHAVIKRIFMPIDAPGGAIRFLKRLSYGDPQGHVDP